MRRAASPIVFRNLASTVRRQRKALRPQLDAEWLSAVGDQCRDLSLDDLSIAFDPFVVLPDGAHCSVPWHDCLAGRFPPGPIPPPCISFHDMMSDTQSSITIFVLPPGTRLPLHDHPGMAVHFTMLHGDLSHATFQLAPPGGQNDSEPRTMTLRGCGSLSRESGPLLFRPTDRLVHEFWVPRTANAAAVFLDVITPPYVSHESNIDCTYFDLLSRDSTVEMPPDRGDAVDSLTQADEGATFTARPKSHTFSVPMRQWYLQHKRPSRDEVA